MFCLLVIVCVLSVQRLPLLSFPSLLLVVTFMFTCSPLLLYQFQGEQAFRDWEWIDARSTLVAMPVIALAFSSFLLGAMLTRTPDPDREDRPIARHDHVDLDERVLRRLGYAMYGVAALLIAASSVSGGALTFAIEGGYHAFHGAKRAGEISQLAGVSLSRLLPWSLIDPHGHQHRSSLTPASSCCWRSPPWRSCSASGIAADRSRRSSSSRAG